MKEINIDFIQKLDESNLAVQCISNIEIKCKNINYYETNKELEKSRVGVYIQLIFEIEYIEEYTSQLKYIEVIKGISDFINLDRPISSEFNLRENIKIIDKGFRLVENSSVAINAIVSI